MTTTSEAIERVLVHEGGYVNDPKDPGGATNFGITEKVARENGYHFDMRYMTKEVAIDIYKKEYWDKCRCDDMPFAVAFQVFDAAVNHGVRNASQWIQRECGASPDGIIGNQTIKAINSSDPVRLILGFQATRINFYTNLSHFDRFGRGWMRRMAGNLRYAWQDLS